MIRIINHREAQTLIRAQNAAAGRGRAHCRADSGRRPRDAATRRCWNTPASSTASKASQRPHARCTATLAAGVRARRAHRRRQHPRIRRAAASRGEDGADIPDGRKLGQIVRPLDSMGAYIPAGRYPLPSTLLMTVIPAQVAGVKTTCVACPHPSAEILGIAAMARRHAFVPDGRRAGDCRIGVRNGDRSASRSHRRSRQHLCRRREEADRGRSRASTSWPGRPKS